MKVARFSADGETTLGLLEGRTVSEMDVDRVDDIELPRDGGFGSTPLTGRTFPVDDVRIESPVKQPGKIICLGLNYADHAEEGGHDVPNDPLLFSKATSAVVGPSEPIVYPSDVSQLDYEAELAVVVGMGGRRIPEEDAVDHVLGCTILNDVSARDVQYSFSQFFRGKSFDSFAPIGPTLADPLSVDISDLGIKTYVNGDVRQDSSTSRMIFSIPEIIASVSRTMTLQPGDVIATGTPPGVGVHREPPELLEVGDKVRIEIEGIGTLENTVKAESPEASSQ